MLSVLLICSHAAAWTYPEHRDIMARALQDLPPEEQRFLAELWRDARSGNESRYCQEMVTGDGRTAPVCLDLAAWPAIAGDHSCSPDKLLTETLPSDWILKVGKVAAGMKVALENAKTRDATLNEWAISNLQLQFVDGDYVGRAGANNGHFLIPRSTNNLDEYLASALAEVAEPNAIGLYLYYHLGALGLVRQWAAATEPAARAGLARQVLATEAFALHFLEDTFSSGHVTGTWGSAAERKGTHDYYCEFGLDTAAWDGTPMVLLGDAHMRPADLTRTGKAVAQSLTQLVEAARAPAGAAGAADSVEPGAALAAAAFDSCTATRQPTATVTPKTLPTTLAVVKTTPIPSRGQDDVHVPHFRQEIGPFVGFSGDLSGGIAFGGYQSGNGDARLTGSGEIEFRIGVGLEALTGSIGAGQAFLGVGYSYATAQYGTFSDPELAAAGVPVVPARSGITVRLRVPFYVIPFDLLLVAPILAWASPSAMTNMGIVAASGGLLRYERAFNTPIGAFQLLLGREVAATFWGYGGGITATGLAAPGATVPYPSNLVFLSYRVLGFDFPTFEYRPLRDFATNQALTFAIQFGWGVEFPNQVSYVSKLTIPAATGPTPELATAWFIYMRLHFDARYYF